MALGGGEAVHLRHLDVHENAVEALRFKQCQSLRTGFRGGDCALSVFQQAADELAVQLFVVDHKEVFSRKNAILSSCDEESESFPPRRSPEATENSG